MIEHEAILYKLRCLVRLRMTKTNTSERECGPQPISNSVISKRHRHILRPATEQLSTARPKKARSQIQSLHIISYHINIISPRSRSKSSVSQSQSLLLLPTKRILHAPSNRAIRVEVLANCTVARKRSADLLADAADGAVLGESAADGALCVESGSFLVGGGLAAGGEESRVLVWIGVFGVECGRRRCS